MNFDHKDKSMIHSRMFQTDVLQSGSIAMLVQLLYKLPLNSSL